MVSLWPWAREDNSPASFERTLSALSTKLNESHAKLESRRQNARRAKALWTLYSSFTYLVIFVIATFAVGYKNWGPVEYTGLAGSPVVIFLIRFAIGTFYEYRTSSMQDHINSLQKQRDTTIAKLKAATKYDSTQELLEKYGGASPRKRRSERNRERSGSDAAHKKSKDGNNHEQRHQQQQNQPQRTGIAPPPTANIPGRNGQPVATTPPPQFNANNRQPSPPNHFPNNHSNHPSPYNQQQQQQMAAEEFAPNAFPAQQYAPLAPPQGPQWYDRLLDVMLGEDEANPRNRLALICANCRLVNGQAPPGVRSLADVGRWRCMACGTVNGEETGEGAEVKKLMREIGAGADGKATPEIRVESPSAGESEVEKGSVEGEKGAESDASSIASRGKKSVEPHAE